MVSVAMSELGHLGAEAHAKALTLKGGVEWESLDHAGREEIVSAAMGQVSLPACAFAAPRRLVWYSLSPSTREGLNSEARNKWSLRALLKQGNEATEACARKIANSEGKDWDSMWTLTQESYRDEAETVCHNCYVGGSAPQTQKDAFHNL